MSLPKGEKTRVKTGKMKAEAVAGDDDDESDILDNDEEWLDI